MKKILVLLTVFSMVFTSCEPLEMINAEADAMPNPIVGDATITLIEDDYSYLDLDNSYFETIDVAKLMVPDLLSDKYPVWGKNSSVNVTFNVDQLVDKIEYTVSAADYTELGVTNLSSDDDFTAFFNYKFPSTEKGTIIDLTYNSPPTIIAYTLTDADFELVGNGRFDNFDIRSGRAEEEIEVRRAKIQTILLNNFPDAKDATKYNVTYAVYDGASGTLEMLLKQQQNEPDASLTTDYTLTDADFALVGNGNYNNFDIRAGKDEETIESRRVKIETILLNNVPGAVSGDLFNVTYAIYNGAAGTRDMLVEFDGTGYTIFSTTSYELYVFALESKTGRFTFIEEWQAPFILSSDDYRAMSQPYNNFNGRNPEQKADALRIIEIYLKMLYPYAADGDFIAVQFRSYEGGGVTATENVNFINDGSKWNGITSMTIQFGHDGSVWVPDNTIKYTLVRNVDYEYMSAQLTGNSDFDNVSLANLASYGDFDYNWSDEQIHFALALFLDHLDPSAAEGQKYILTYVIYDNGENDYQTSFIKTDAAWVVND